jgi:predicted esterase
MRRSSPIASISCTPRLFASAVLLGQLLLACSSSESDPSQADRPTFGGFNPSASPTAPGTDESATPPAAEDPDPVAPPPPDSEGTPNVSALNPAPAPGSDMTAGESSPPATPPPSDTAMDPMPSPPAPTDTEQTGTTPITPSEGCGKGNPPTGQLSMTIRGNRADYLVTLPANYSTTSPSPLIFGFHGRNRTYLEFEQVDASQIRTELEPRAVMVFPQSQGGPGWNFAAEVPPSIEFFEALYSQMLANYCVDTSHVFAIGHSSGAYFSDILACRYGDRLRGIGDVSGALQEQNCTGNVAAIVTHGPNDTVVPFTGGVAMRDFYLARNGCSQMTIPGPDSPCVTYQGCQAGLPVAWCQHTEPTYTDAATGRPTNHGWPSFASKAIADFLFALP